MKSWNASPVTSKESRDGDVSRFLRVRELTKKRESAVLEKNPYEKSATERNSSTVGTNFQREEKRTSSHLTNTLQDLI